MAQRPTTLLPTDPLFVLQWHLHNTGQIAGGVVGQDINVIQAWPDYSGQGVLVAVFDDGFDQTHPDLIANYRADLSWDFILNIPGALPVASDDDHGTAVAGLIGASANNRIGGVGVAWNAGLIGYRGLGEGGLLVEDFAKGGVRMLDAGADISSNSWGPMMTAFDSQADQPGYVATVTNLATQGRDGLGTVVMFAAGNDRETQANTNYDPTNNIPYSINVAASKSNGLVTDYSTPGASVLVTAPGSDPLSIVTTDLQGSAGYNTLAGEAGDYTDIAGSFFGGTSAAAPIAAGVVALMLEANPRLGYRDVQEILVYSSQRAVFLDAPGIQSDVNQAVDWNGGGLLTGYDFGFGNIDARAAVRLAESWQKASTTQNLALIEGDVLTRSLAIDAGGQAQAAAVFTQDNRVEQVTLSIDLQTERLQDVRLELVSPGGTRSLLIDQPPIQNDDDGNPVDLPTQLVYTLNTVRAWGESLQGEWTLLITNAETGAPITLNNWSIKAHAADLTVPSTQIFTDEFATFAGLDASRLTISSTNGIDLNAAAVTTSSVLDMSGGASAIGGVGITLTGLDAFRNLFGGDGDDHLIGNDLDNHLLGGRGNNVIDGGAGWDTALYIGGRSFYSVQKLNDGYQVSSNVISGGGTDSVFNVQNFNFGATSLLAKSALDQTQTFGSFYDALFDRAADGEGLRFWTDAYFDSGLTELDVALGFVTAPEDNVASLNNQEFVTRLYVLGLERAPDAPGFEFWTNALQTQQVNRGDILLGFVQSTEFIDNRLDQVSIQVSQLGDIWA